MSDHLSAGQAERFVRSELLPTETRTVLRHLAAGCWECSRLLSPLFQLLRAPDQIREEEEPQEDSGSRYDEPLSRALASALSRRPEALGKDRLLAERGVALLRSKARGVWDMTDEEAWELRGWPMIEVLLQLSFEERYRDPQAMVNYALLAQTAAHNLDPKEHDPLMIADCQARAWAELGNAYRVNDDLGRAQAAFGKAAHWLEQGTGNLLLQARIADLYASLLRAQRQLPDARELLGSVFQLYRKVGDDHLAGRALVSQAICASYADEPREALRLLREGVLLLDRSRDPKLAVFASESELEVLVHCGEYREAGAQLLRSGLRQHLAGAPLSLAKLRCVEGRILAGLGKPMKAETAFREARAEFLAHDQAYDAALVGLDLAAVWLEAGKNDQAAELAQDMLATFQRLGIQREAQRAMAVFESACRQRRGTPHLAREVGRFLKRLEREPQLRFEAS